MKIISSLLCLAPVIACAGTAFEANPESVKSCYNTLQISSSKEDVLSAISCLKSNPFAGEAGAKDFFEEKAAVIGKYNQGPEAAELSAALNELSAQKKSRLYIAYQSSGQPRTIMAVEKSLLQVYRKPNGLSIVPIYDLKAANPKFAEQYKHLTNDIIIDFKDVAAFGLKDYSRGGAGKLITVHKDGSKVFDDFYMIRYPLRIYDSNNKEWRDIGAFVGTTYNEWGQSQNTQLNIDIDSLSTFSISIIGEAEANKAIAEMKKEAQARKNTEDIARQEAANKAAAIQKIKAGNLAQMAKAKIGVEDSCKRTDLNKYVVIKDPTAQDVDIECDFGGLINLKGLKNAGWLVVNKQWREDVVTEYLIRKAR